MCTYREDQYCDPRNNSTDKYPDVVSSKFY